MTDEEIEKIVGSECCVATGDRRRKPSTPTPITIVGLSWDKRAHCRAISAYAQGYCTFSGLLGCRSGTCAGEGDVGSVGGFCGFKAGIGISRSPIRSMPVSARRQLNDLPDELWTEVSIEFYKDPADAVFKALVE